MSSIYVYECRIDEARRKIVSLEEELDNLYMMKNEVSKGADTIQGQIGNKRKTASNLLMLESRLPLVRSLNGKVQNNIDDTFRYNILAKYDDINEEVNNVIKKVNDEIDDQNDIIKQCKLQIIRIQEEERREAERREAERREAESKRRRIS
jgi:predicted  nucleic acid-binding Zn-ribbon protein